MAGADKPDTKQNDSATDKSGTAAKPSKLQEEAASLLTAPAGPKDAAGTQPPSGSLLGNLTHDIKLFGEGVVSGVVSGTSQLADHVLHTHIATSLQFSNQQQVDNSWAGQLGESVGKVVNPASQLLSTKDGMLFTEGVVSGGVFNAVNGVTELSNHLFGTNIGSLQLDNQQEVDNSVAGKVGEVVGTGADMVGVTLLTGGAAEAVGLTGYAALATSAGTAGAIQGGLFTPTGDSGNFVTARLENAAIGAASGVAGGMAGVGANALAEGMDSTLARTAVKFGGNAAAGGLTGVGAAEATSLATTGELAKRDQVIMALGIGAASGALGGFGPRSTHAPESTGQGSLEEGSAVSRVLNKLAKAANPSGKDVAEHAPYQPETFRPERTQIKIGANQTQTVEGRLASATQSLDEEHQFRLSLAVDTKTGDISTTFSEHNAGFGPDGTKIPAKAIADGLEVDVNGKASPWHQQNIMGYSDESHEALNMPVLRANSTAGEGTSSIDVSFYGKSIGKYSYDPTTSTLTRLEAPQSLSTFDIREFNARPDFAKEWKQNGVTINDHELPANQIDLHTHFGGAMRADTIMEVGQQVHTPYPTELLDQYGIRYKPEAVKMVDGKPTITIDPENFGPGGYRKLENMMSIPEDNRTDFPDMERIYKMRSPLTKDVNAFPKYLEALAKDYQQQGVHYAELSVSDIVKPEWLQAAHDALPKIEQETGVNIKFLVSMWRHEKGDYNMNLINKIKEIGKDPYIAGADFNGEETNSTMDFARELKALAEIRKTRPEFQIRVHAGENHLNPENIKEAIRLGATRIGHGVYGVDDETLALAKEHNVIIEFNSNSNIALSNIEAKQQLPVKRYLDAGVRVTLGTDGHGLYNTTARSEEAVMKELGLTQSDLAKITASDKEYTDTMIQTGMRKKMDETYLLFIVNKAFGRVAH